MLKYLFLLLIGSTFVCAQTPEQLEMLRRRQEKDLASEQLQQTTEIDSQDDKATPASVDARLTAQKRMENQDKLVITTGNFKILQSATGMKLCTLELGLTNYTKYPVEKVQVFFKWGEVETYAIFSGIPYEQTGKLSIGLAGSVCNRITEEPNLRVTTCQLQGAPESFCQSAIVYNQG